MQIVELSTQEVSNLAEDLAHAAATAAHVLVAIDGLPHEAAPTFKVKINGGIWSPPMGKPCEH